MKILSCSVWLLGALSLLPAQADVALNAPGVPVGSQYATGVPFRNTFTLQQAYKFIFLGTETRGTTTGAPGSAQTSGNGGKVVYKAFVDAKGSGTSRTGAIQLTFSDIETFNSSPLQTLLLSPAVSFVATATPIDVDLTWAAEGNGKRPTGFFNILGEYQKAPPIPTGTLNFPNGSWELKTSTSNSNPTGTVTIVRQ